MYKLKKKGGRLWRQSSDKSASMEEEGVMEQAKRTLSQDGSTGDKRVLDEQEVDMVLGLNKRKLSQLAPSEPNSQVIH